MLFILFTPENMEIVIKYRNLFFVCLLHYFLQKVNVYYYYYFYYITDGIELFLILQAYRETAE